MSEGSKTLEKTLEQLTRKLTTMGDLWEILNEQKEWPVRLTPFVNSRLVDVEEGDATTDVLIIELSPGMTADSVFHLANSLASLFDLALGAVQMEAIEEKARRVKVTIAKAANA